MNRNMWIVRIGKEKSFFSEFKMAYAVATTYSNLGYRVTMTYANPLTFGR